MARPPGGGMTHSRGMTVQLVRSARLFPGAPYAYAARAHEEIAGLPQGAGRQALTTLVDYTISRHG